MRVEAHPEEIIPIVTDVTKESDPTAPVTTDKLGRPLWEIDPGVPFIGSPVHERMTVAALTMSKILGRPYRIDRDEAYIHGVFWNDDPEDLLCPKCNAFNLLKFNRRWGIAFATRFSTAKKQVRSSVQNGSDVVFKVGDGLLERSHFGDLQFLHAMASSNDEPASVTQTKILVWAEFVYRVSIGDIPQKTKISKISILSIRNLFIADKRLVDLTVEELFRGRIFARRVAIGSLLHMIQDSYAPGHAAREVLDHKISNRMVFARGAISEFHCYTEQDEKLHAEDDKWPNGLDELSPIGSNNPITVGAILLGHMAQSTPWGEVEKYLKETVFAIENPNTLSGPGERYRKKLGKAIEP